jgi:hypothetical protein
MDSPKYMTKIIFAESLGISIRGLYRLAEKIQHKFPHGLLSPYEQGIFKKKVKKWEREQHTDAE